MMKTDRSRKSVRRRPSLHVNLERLEERQMLSTAAVGNPTAFPIVRPNVQSATVTPLITPVNPSAFYTVSQVRTAYGLDSIVGQGQGQTVAIVDAYSQPFIQSDLSAFSSIMGLPQMDGVGGRPTFSVVVPPGQSTPQPDVGWGIEISLDVEWVHAIAPYANIVLVTCQDNSYESLLAAEIDGMPFASGVGYAKSLPGVSVVSNSYGSDEFFGENFYDSAFTTSRNNVAFVFSTGDTGANGSWPAYAPNVVAVGGTSLHTSSIKGRYGSESGWSGPPGVDGSGGGVSQFESTPSYQSSHGINFGARSTPDVSWLADPNTGVLVLDSYTSAGPGAIYVVGGTSLAAPMWSALIALGDQARGAAGSLSSTGVLNALYGAYASPQYATDFHDITTGNNGYPAGIGYDLVTGIGTPKTLAITNLLAGAAPGVATRGTFANQGLQITEPLNIVVSPGQGVTNGRLLNPTGYAGNTVVAQAVPLPDSVLSLNNGPKPKKAGSLFTS